MNSTELSELVKDLKDGGKKKLELIFEKNASYCIRGLVRQHNCHVEDAEDIYTDAILNFREKILSGKIEALTDVKSYLYATCKNMFLVRLKKEQRTMRAIQETQNLYQNSYDFEHSDYKEQMVYLAELGLEALGEKCKEILMSFYFLRLSLEEIASRYNMANANVAKVSKSRCLQKLVNEIKSIQQHKVGQ